MLEQPVRAVTVGIGVAVVVAIGHIGGFLPRDLAEHRVENCEWPPLTTRIFERIENLLFLRIESSRCREGGKAEENEREELRARR